LPNVTFDAFFEDTMFHEVAHGLGVKHVLGAVGAPGATTVCDALEDAEGARLDAQVELHVERVAQQGGAAGEAEEELLAEAPAEWIHVRARVGIARIMACTAAQRKTPAHGRGFVDPDRTEDQSASTAETSGRSTSST
jgi:hypothetical protein